jgi:tetratricopeptide (TPR) repeat protein
MLQITSIFASLWLTLGTVLAQAPAQVDPVALAKSQRYAGQLDQAEATLKRVLAANPNHYLAIYNMGLVYEARAQRTAASARSPLLLVSASWLERARVLRNNPKLNIQEYTIYNTLGYVYLQLRDIAKAEIVLNEGKVHEAKLTPTSQAKFNNNLGYLASLKGDRAAASLYFSKSAKAGNMIARQNSIGILKSSEPNRK